MLVIGVSVDHVQGYEGLACWGIACLGALAFFAVAAVGATWINRSQHDAARRALVERGAVFYERVRYRGTALLAIHWGRVDLAIHESGDYNGAPRRGLGGGPFVR